MSERVHTEYRPQSQEEINRRNRGLAQDHDLLPAEFKDWLRRWIESEQPGLRPSSIFGFGDAIRRTYLNVRTELAAYTATDDDNVALVNPFGGPFAVQLPTAVGRQGKVLTFKHISGVANTVSITPAGAEGIDGAATYDLTGLNMAVTIVSDGLNWQILSSYP